jgi:hypothetical protein
MKPEDAVNLGCQIIDLLHDSRGKKGILTVESIPCSLRKRLTKEEEYKVLAWMKIRQTRGKLKCRKHRNLERL